MARGTTGLELLPTTTVASLVASMLFLTAMGWWRYAGHRELFGVRVPFPGRWTFLSGLCSAAVIGTTTLAYTFSGISIVFMMLLMRGGVLILAPLVDAVSRRKVRWTAWVALGLSLGAVTVASVDGSNAGLTLVATVDVAVYLACYFVRLRFMSHLAKSDDPTASRRYFVEEQMVATPAIVLALGVLAAIGEGPVMGQLRDGFTGFLSRGTALAEVAVGVLSQGTGIFGPLILLDHRENSFCVPVNRASSVLAGVFATAGLSLLWGLAPVSGGELLGAGLVMAAIFTLALPGLWGRYRAARVEPAAMPRG
jgi:hypothetical protein